ncbi:Rv1733c family protein [Streptomyces sp. 24-1644]|uniref:Rv1733c family protein n=1 Tax=Streptomyces sp. 24-1644 TaxID=3457315 RepID=UPI003FA7C38D
MRAVSGVWRWRHNPLRRATDRVEAWVALLALLLMLLAAPVIGWTCGSLTDDALQRSVRAQRAERHVTTAVVVRRVDRPGQFAGDSEVASERAAQTSVVARWRTPDGAVRTGRVSTASRVTGPGAEVRIWTDDRGRPTLRPMDASTAHTHAALAGSGVFLLSAGLVEAARRLIMWRLRLRRYARLDRAWAKAGPDWGRTGTGS